MQINKEWVYSYNDIKLLIARDIVKRGVGLDGGRVAYQVHTRDGGPAVSSGEGFAIHATSTVEVTIWDDDFEEAGGDE